MLDWLFGAVASVTAMAMFFSIFLVGFVFSSLSIILGGHGDADHDMGDHDVDHDTSDHGGDHHDGEHSGSGASSIFSVGMLSVRGMALLATGFGGAGTLAQIQTGRVYFSTAIGMVVGYLFAFFVLFTLQVFRSQQANSLIDISKAVGVTATVVTSIPHGGYGEIRCVVSGTEVTKTAVSKDGRAIKSGTRVRIEEADGATLVVVPSNAAQL